MSSAVSVSLLVRISCVLLALCGTLSATAAVREIPPVSVRAATNAPGLDDDVRLYIVQLRDPPALALGGRATRDAAKAGARNSRTADARRRFDPEASEVRSHVDRLRAQQERVLLSVGAWQNEVYSYRYTFNGFAAKLTARQADRLRLRKDVAGVWEDRRRRVATSDSPAFLGLFDASNGLRSARGLTGEGVVIGVIDSGIAPGHPSFADTGEPEQPGFCRSNWAQNTLLGLFLCRKYRVDGPPLFDALPAGWNGTCETGENFGPSNCNLKLIGARFYNEGFLAAGPADPKEFESPADADGHGTHIASIAAGNEVVAEIFDRRIGRIGGMAPRARVAVYKACWLEPGAFRATCSVADLQAAIEDAVADGVDIINYSVGDSNGSLTDPDDLALLAAADAGILSVVASGNSGPSAFTIDSPGTTPWVLTVGASTRPGDRLAEGIRVNRPDSLANDYESREASFTPELSEVGPVTANLVLVQDGVVQTPEGATGTVTDGCSEPQNADEINNNIAFIQRGGCDFDLKVALAQDAGAVGVVVFNNDGELVVMAGDSAGIDIPAVMLNQADGLLLRDAITADETVQVTLDKSIFINLRDTGNLMGTFSGRGPSAADSDFLKPDVVAPGVQILGGQAREVANAFPGQEFQYLSGTSQSTPHVAGIAALLMEAHPEWDPSAIKSALMTSARQNILVEAGGDNADPFDFGAGHIVPNAAADPGLVYEVSPAEYDAYLCTVGLPRVSEAECQALRERGFAQDARDINLPSLAITELVATADVTRRVRNVGPPARFDVEVDTPDGVRLEVLPPALDLATNETAEFTLRFSSESGALNEWLFGSYLWTSATHSVRSPFAVQPRHLAAPDELRAEGATGTQPFAIRFGYTGSYSAAPFGLERPCVLPDNNLDDAFCTNTSPAVIADDPDDAYQFTEIPAESVERFFLRVGANDLLLRLLLDDRLTSGTDDLDLYLHYCVTDSNSVTEASACDDVLFEQASQNDRTSGELIDVLFPQAGIWIVDVHGYNTDPAGDGTASFCLFSWALDPGDDADNLSVTGGPASARTGQSSELTASWTNLGEGLWLGGIAHRMDAADLLDYSFLEVDVNGLPDPDPRLFICP